MAISSPINTKKLKTLTTVSGLASELFKQRKKRLKLENKFERTQALLREKQFLREKERRQERKKPIDLKEGFGKFIRRQQIGAGGIFFDLLKFIITYKAVQWLGNPENIKKIQGLSKALLGIFKFLNFFVGGSIDNALSGIHDLLFGDTILERFVGFFRGIVGLFGLRYLLNPLKLIKDLKFVVKNSGKILDIFKVFKNSGIKEGADTLIKSLPKTANIFKRGIGRALTRGFLRIFGKGGVQLISKLIAPLKNIVLGTFKAAAKTTVKGIPIVGPLLDLGLNLAFGDPLDKALFKAGGSFLGMGLGGLIGSLLPGPGTIVGGALGGILGDWAASKLYDWFKSAQSKTPQLATGGIVTSPTKAIIGEAGPEAVIPLNNIFSGTLLSAPFGILASSLIGGVNAVLLGLGPIGTLIRPFSTQLFAPYVKKYGVNNFTFNSDIGSNLQKIETKNLKSEDESLKKIIGDSSKVKLLNSKNKSKKTRYNSGNTVVALLGDIFNNIMNLNTSRGGSSQDNKNQNIENVNGEVDLSSSDDVTLLKQLALAEAAGEGVTGMALVINSVLNRKRILDSGKSPGFYGANDKSIRGIIYGPGQYTPVDNGSINKQWGEGSLKLAEEALNLAKNKTSLIQKLKAENLSDATIKYLINSTGFRNYSAGAGTDRSQQVNETQYKRHTFNTAGVSKLQKGGKVTLYSGHADMSKAEGGIGTNGGPTGNAPKISAASGYFSTEAYLNDKIAQQAAAKSGGLAIYRSPIRTPGGWDPGKGNWARAKADTTAGHYPIEVHHDAESGKAGIIRKKKNSIFNAIGSSFGGDYGTDTNKGFINAGGAILEVSALTSAIRKDPGSWISSASTKLANAIKAAYNKPITSDESVSPGDSPTTPSDSESEDTEDTEEPFNPTKIANLLGQLYKGLTGNYTQQNTLMSKSMDVVQSKRQVPFMSNTYIMTPPSTSIQSMNVLMPLEQVDYSSASFANLDTPIYTPKRL